MKFHLWNMGVKRILNLVSRGALFVTSYNLITAKSSFLY